jgi:hypothetical protein
MANLCAAPYCTGSCATRQRAQGLCQSKHERCIQGISRFSSGSGEVVEWRVS